MYVLIVDDDEDTRDAMADALEAHGFNARGAGNGKAALDVLAGSDKPFVILLDLSMPVMDGYEFRAAQLANPASAGIPVILISGEKTARLNELKPHAVVPKPIELSKLVEAIQRCAR